MVAIPQPASRGAMRRQAGSRFSGILPEEAQMSAQAMPPTILREIPKLARIAAALRQAFGARLASALLFGSRARGDHRPDSDYDVAVFLESPAGLWDELGRLAHITTDILDDTGAVISAKPFAAQVYQDRSPLMQEIRTQGVEF